MTEIPKTWRQALSADSLKALERAIAIAARSGSTEVNTLHLLVGIQQDRGNVAAHGLEKLGAWPPSVVTKARELWPGWDSASDEPSEPRLEENSEASIARVVRNARKRSRHGLIEPEQLLLAMADEPNSEGMQVLGMLGFIPDAVKIVVESIFKPPPLPPPPYPTVEVTQEAYQAFERQIDDGILDPDEDLPERAAAFARRVAEAVEMQLLTPSHVSELVSRLFKRLRFPHVKLPLEGSSEDPT